MQKLSYMKPGWFFILLVVIGLVSGLAIRLYDLGDPPFDFHPTRQFRSAIIARDMYYQTLDDLPEEQKQQVAKTASKESIIEPQVLERLAAWLYQLSGSERLWLPRMLSALVWVLAGLAVLLLGRELATLDGGLVAMFYFLFVPYGIYASRTFQPDPLMIGLIAWAIWAVVRWYHARTIKSAVLAGVLGGLAIYIKSVAVFFVGGAFIGLIIFGVGLLQALRDRQIWLMGVLTVLPTTLFYIYGLWIAGFLQKQMNYRFFPDMLRDPAFYIRWQEMATNIAGFGALLAALLAMLAVQDKGKRGMLAGMWIGYGVYSLTFPYHTLTHDYYQLPLILIIAISLTVIFGEIFERTAALDLGVWGRGFVVLLLFAGAFFKAWDVRVNLARTDHSKEIGYWENIGGVIKPGKRTLSMSHAYGYYLSYYGGVPNDPWPGEDDLYLRDLAGKDSQTLLQNQFAAINDYDYFVITKMGDFNSSPELKEVLFNEYYLMAEGDGYFIFNLNKNAEDD